MLKIMQISDIVGMKLFTDSGDFLGVVEEANIVDNKLDSWRVKVGRESTLAPLLSGARGLVIPHQYIKAFGEVVIVSKAAVPVKEEISDESLA